MLNNKIRIATRKSALALWQANTVKSALEKKYSNYAIQLVEVETEGDKTQVADFILNDKSIFVKALQTALLKNEADIAVHSIKDLSVNPVEHLVLAAVMKRGDPRDVFVSQHFTELNALPKRAVVGSASPRRIAILKSLRPDLQIKPLRGNVDTRIQKLISGQYDAVILAAAGLQRLQLTQWIRHYFAVDVLVPAIGQGAIGIECRENDENTREMMHFLNHSETARCITAERTVNQLLGGDCNTPIGAYAIEHHNQLQLIAMLGNLAGTQILKSSATGDSHRPEKLGEMVVNLLRGHDA